MSKITPYPLRIVKCAKASRGKSIRKSCPPEKPKHPFLNGKRGDGFPLTIAVTLCLLLIICGISEYFRLTIIAQGVRDAVQQTVISTINDNFDDVYHAVREGYAAGYSPTDDDSWVESIDTGNIYAQLAVNMDGVGLDRCRADVQAFADFSVACSLSHQLQHFNLAGAQALFGRGAHPRHEASGDGGGQNGVSPGGGAYGAEQLFTGGIFQQIAGCPGLDSAQDIGVRIVGGQDDDTGRWLLGQDRLNGSHAIQAGHA